MVWGLREVYSKFSAREAERRYQVIKCLELGAVNI